MQTILQQCNSTISNSSEHLTIASSYIYHGIDRANIDQFVGPTFCIWFLSYQLFIQVLSHLRYSSTMCNPDLGKSLFYFLLIRSNTCTKCIYFSVGHFTSIALLLTDTMMRHYNSFIDHTHTTKGTIWLLYTFFSHMIYFSLIKNIFV